MNDDDLLIPSSTTEDDDDVAVSMAVEVASAIASAASEIRKVMSDKCSCCGNVRDKDDVVLIFCFESEDLGGDNLDIAYPDDYRCLFLPYLDGNVLD